MPREVDLFKKNERTSTCTERNQIDFEPSSEVKIWADLISESGRDRSKFACIAARKTTKKQGLSSFSTEPLKSLEEKGKNVKKNKEFLARKNLDSD